MAAKKKNTSPKITDKWYDFNIDPETLKVIEISWDLTYERKVVRLYETDDNPNKEVMHINLRNNCASYYFVFDKRNKRIFAYPIALSGHETRKSCPNAQYKKLNHLPFYMFDKDKQMWQINRTSSRMNVRWNPVTRQYDYDLRKPGAYKVSRISTMYYNVQAQLTSHVRSMFAELYGEPFVYQRHIVTDADIRSAGYAWTSWLAAKGRKYSEKTIKDTQEIMSKISSDRRRLAEMDKGEERMWEFGVTLETVDGMDLLAYYSSGEEIFRQVLNKKTNKMAHYIWKNNGWSKSSKPSDYGSVHHLMILPSYRQAHVHDYQYIAAAKTYYENSEYVRHRWYSSDYHLYQFIKNYVANPVAPQLLQIQDQNGRNEMFKNYCGIQSIYGKIPNKGRNIYARLGVNKYQFNNPNLIFYVKELLKTDSIYHIDNQTWDRYAEAFVGKKTLSYPDEDIILSLRSRGEFSIDRWIKICQLDQIGKLKYGMSGYTGNVRTIYRDYYRLLDAMEEFGIDTSAYPLVFNDVQQLRRYHDEASVAVSSVKNRALDERFAMLYEKRLKMLEDDGTYMIAMPKCSSDLTLEGSHLHHCVGGYARSVADGNTAIYFLRKSAEPNVPWLTVEVRNKRCQQIHGSCNAWMGSKDEYFDAVPFLVWWFEKHDIECSDNLLTNCATGYSSCATCRSMPTQRINEYKESKKKNKK